MILGRVGLLQMLHLLQMLQVWWCNIVVGMRPLLESRELALHQLMLHGVARGRSA
jgi:hypothetical protein